MSRSPLAALLMLLPSFALVAGVIGYPIADLIEMSTHVVNRFGRVGSFVAAANFSELSRDPIFWASFWRTIVWTLCVTGASILVSIPVALVLVRDFSGRWLARLIVLLPWAVSATMTGIVWRWILDEQYGWLNAVLLESGAIDQPIGFLATGNLAFPAAIFIGILSAIPLTVVIFLGGLSSLPTEIFDAARMDGARRFTLFRYLTLPLIRPFIEIAVVLNVIYAFNSFAIIWVLTQGGPANSTDILVTYLYKVAFQYGKLAEASAMSLVMFTFLLACSIVYALLARRTQAA
jgi:multiple sugar transport system permease protein